MSEKEQLDNGNFAGFPSYENSYDYDLARITLDNAMNELRNNPHLIEQLGVNSNNTGRGIITGHEGDGVWDYLSMDHTGEEDFTKDLHLTLWINETAVEASITIPHNLATDKKNKIKELEINNFKRDCQTILNNMTDILRDNPQAQPILRGIQRHYPSRRAQPIIDTLIETDLRTAFENGNVQKYQPQWLPTVYDVFCNKESNYQMQIGMSFSYTRCPNIKGENALDLIIASWLACKPLIDACK